MEDLAALARRVVDTRRMLRFVCGNAQTVSLIKPSCTDTYCLLHFFSMMSVSAVPLKRLPTGIRAPPAIRVATCVHDPSGFFSKASQGRSARPAGYEVIV